MVVSTSRSGAGSWRLVALDEAYGSVGIRSFIVKLSGTVSSALNRSPVTAWSNVDVVTSPARINDVRTTTPPIGAGQGPTNPVQIDGYGRTVSNFGLTVSSHPRLRIHDPRP